MGTNDSLLLAIDQLAGALHADPGDGDGPEPGHYVDWLMRMRAQVEGDPDGEVGATARRRIHAALVCGDHTPLERAIARFRQTPDLAPLIAEIEALTSDRMYACPCCACLTIPDRPPGSWCRCPVCGWMDDGTTDGGGPNRLPLVEAQQQFKNRVAPPAWLRDPRPEEIPSAADGGG